MEIKTISLSQGYGVLQLIIDEKTALVDTATGSHKDELIGSLKDILGDRKLDYIFCTHSHFDHIGTISYIRHEYPDVKLVASAKTAKVFKSEGALAFMKYMTEMVCKVHGTEAFFDASGLYVDIIAEEGTKIELGESTFTVLETKGHTDCSISFYCKEKALLFASESIGVWYDAYPPDLEVCKGYMEVLSSIDKLKKLDVKELYLLHTGLFTDGRPSEYFTMAEHCMIYNKTIVYDAIAEGRSDEEIGKLCKEKIYDVMNQNGIKLDSLDRWMVNTKAFIEYSRKDYNSTKIE